MGSKKSEQSRDAGDREMEEYLRQKRLERQRDVEVSEKDINESATAKFRNFKGGLLEDENDEYFAAPNIEQMKSDILKIELERKAALEKLVGSKPLETDSKPHQTTGPAQPKRIDANNPPGYVVTALQSQTIKNQSKTIATKGGENHRGRTSQNDSGVDVFQRSDFFNDFGSPTKQREALGKPPTRQKGHREESFFDGERSSRYMQGANSSSVKLEQAQEHPPVHSMPLHPRLAELEKENQRLKSENIFLSKEKSTLDLKLQELLTGTVKNLKEELMANGSSTLLTRVKLLESDLKMCNEEKETYFAKYKDIYERYQKELEGERVRNKSILDPKKLLELSRLNTTLIEDKKTLEKELRDERERSRNLTHFKEDFEKTKLELESKVNGLGNTGHKQDFRSNDTANNSILRPLRQEAEYKEENNLEFDINGNKERDSRYIGPNQATASTSSQKANSLQTTQIGKDQRGGPLSQVQPIEQLECSKLDESDLDFLGNFHKELDMALNKINVIDRQPYNYSSNSIFKPAAKTYQSTGRWQESSNYISKERNLQIEPIYGRHFRPTERSEDQDVFKSVNLDDTAPRSSSVGLDGRKTSARFGTQSSIMNFPQESTRHNLVNFSSFNPTHPAPQGHPLSPYSKDRFTSPGPNWFGYGKRAFAHPERGSANSLLEPFPSIYDEIPLPRKPVGSSHASTIQGRPGQDLGAYQGDWTSSVRPKVRDFRVPGSESRSGGNSLAASHVRDEPISRPQRPRVDSAAVLQASPPNLLNFKACSVFSKGVLFAAKGEFEISAKSTVNDRRDAAEVSLGITLKSLKDNLVVECCLVQEAGKRCSSRHLRSRRSFARETFSR